MDTPKTIKRFVLFAGDESYPSGGWRDFKDSFDTYDEADRKGMGSVMINKWEWYHIIDLEGAPDQYVI